MLQGLEIADIHEDLAGPAPIGLAHDALRFEHIHDAARTSIPDLEPALQQRGGAHAAGDNDIGDHSIISYSVAEGAKIGNHVTMGPFCHLRKGAVLGDHVHLGNFGEVKDSVLHEGVKMGHFSYIGNADIGKNVNIGAGTITCNYDGQRKNSTEIGEETFIGSDTMLVAPLKIGKRATTGAGSVVTHDVPDDTTVLGVPARPRQRKENCD